MFLGHLAYIQNLSQLWKMSKLITNCTNKEIPQNTEQFPKKILVWKYKAYTVPKNTGIPGFCKNTVPYRTGMKFLIPLGPAPHPPFLFVNLSLILPFCAVSNEPQSRKRFQECKNSTSFSEKIQKKTWPLHQNILINWFHSDFPPNGAGRTLSHFQAINFKHFIFTWFPPSWGGEKLADLCSWRPLG